MWGCFGPVEHFRRTINIDSVVPIFGYERVTTSPSIVIVFFSPSILSGPVRTA